MNASKAPRRAAALGYAALCLHLLAGGAAGFVNPNFTPVDVQRQCKLICLSAAAPADGDARQIALAIGEVIKGESDAKAFTLDLTKARAHKDGVADIKTLVELLGQSPARRMLVFVPGPDAQEPNVLLHVEGVWFRALADAAGRFSLDRMDSSLNGTFNGGTDMLAEAMRFITALPDRPVMPVDPGVKWDGHKRVGKLPGKPAAVETVDIDGDGRLDVFAASPGGDKAFLATANGGFQELPLASASLACDWADFDGDGRADLASLSADGLKLHLQIAAGKFQALPVDLPGKPRTDSPAVQAADLDADGRPDLLVSLAALPAVLLNRGGGKFAAVPLAASVKEPDKFAGLPGPCAAGDFDGDGRLDVLQCMQNDGLLFRGKPDGTLAPGAACGAAMGAVKQRSIRLADLDGDGRLDVFLVGGGARPEFYVFRDGRFASVARFLGEPSYIVQAGAACVALGDFNNDSFVDMFVGYAEEKAQCFFNRGFRSLAICEPLNLPADELAGADKGQPAACWSDIDGDGAAELLVALANGEIHLSRTSLAATTAPLAIAARLGPKAGFAGPLAVTLHVEGRCLGARLIRPDGRPAVFGVPSPGDYTVKWTPPGKPEQSPKVAVTDGVAKLVIGQ